MLPSSHERTEPAHALRAYSQLLACCRSSCDSATTERDPMRNCSTPASSATGAMPATGARQCRAIVAAIHGMKSKLCFHHAANASLAKLVAVGREARYHRHHRSSGRLPLLPIRSDTMLLARRESSCSTCKGDLSLWIRYGCFCAVLLVPHVSGSR